MLRCDVLKLEIMDAKEENEDWALTWHDDEAQVPAVRILVNGKDLIDIAVPK